MSVVADGVVSREERSTTSDSQGHYEIPAVRAQSSAPLLSAYQPGFFTDARWSPGVGDQQVDFELSRLAFIQIGSAVRSPSPNGVCAGVGYGDVRCHRFAVVAPATAILVVTITAAAITGDVDILGPRGTPAHYLACPCSSPLQIRLPVEKGETYEIRATQTPALGVSTLLERTR